MFCNKLFRWIDGNLVTETFFRDVSDSDVEGISLLEDDEGIFERLAEEIEPLIGRELVLDADDSDCRDDSDGWLFDEIEDFDDVDDGRVTEKLSSPVEEKVKTSASPVGERRREDFAFECFVDSDEAVRIIRA